MALVFLAWKISMIVGQKAKLVDRPLRATFDLVENLSKIIVTISTLTKLRTMIHERRLDPIFQNLPFPDRCTVIPIGECS